MDNLLTRPSIPALNATLTSTGRAMLGRVRAEADRLGVELWAVGGTVRDTATRHALVDIDLAADRDVQQLTEAAGAALGGSVTTEARFGTASIAVEGNRLDLATLRAERYDAPGALPRVTLGAPIERDLERRDFSVNAIALGLSARCLDQVLDPYGGLDDLARRRFRVLHDRSFEDDATRIWRAARLSTWHRLRPDRRTDDLLTDGTRRLDTISGDRLWSEFVLIAERGRAGRTLGLLDRWGALDATSPALALSSEARAALRHRWRPLPVGQLAAVLLATRDPAPARVALTRLNAPSEVHRTVEETRALLSRGDDSPDHLETLAASSEQARRAARWLDPRQRERQRELRRWERTRPHLDARQLLALGVPEGPWIGTLLRCLRRRRYLGTLSTAAEARTLVRHHLEQQEGTR